MLPWTRVHNLLEEWSAYLPMSEREAALLLSILPVLSDEIDLEVAIERYGISQEAYDTLSFLYEAMEYFEQEQYAAQEERENIYRKQMSKEVETKDGRLLGKAWSRRSNSKAKQRKRGRN